MKKISLKVRLLEERKSRVRKLLFNEEVTNQMFFTMDPRKRSITPVLHKPVPVPVSIAEEDDTQFVMDGL